MSHSYLSLLVAIVETFVAILLLDLLRRRYAGAASSQAGAPRYSFGLWFLFSAISIWAIDGWLDFTMGGGPNADLVLWAALSSANNAAFLCAAPHLDHGFERLETLRRRPEWYILVGSSLFMISLAAYLMRNSSGWPRVETIYSMLTAAVLMPVMMRSFSRRGMPILALLAVAALISQVVLSVRLWDETVQTIMRDDMLVHLLSAKFALTLLVVAVGMSWHSTRDARAGKPELNIRLLGGNEESSRFSVRFDGSLELDKTVSLTKKPYERLLLFALARKQLVPRCKDGVWNKDDNPFTYENKDVDNIRNPIRHDLIELFSNDNKGGYSLNFGPSEIDIDLESQIKTFHEEIVSFASGAKLSLVDELTSLEGDRIERRLVRFASGANTKQNVGVEGMPEGVVLSDDGILRGIISEGASQQSPYRVSISLSAEGFEPLYRSFKWTVQACEEKHAESGDGST